MPGAFRRNTGGPQSFPNARRGAPAHEDFFRCGVKTPPRFGHRPEEGPHCVRYRQASALACLMPTLYAMRASNSKAEATGAPEIHVATADGGGWVVTIDRDGQTVAIERYSDWHRVERRVAILRRAIGSDNLRVAATLIGASILGTWLGG